ncbi:hypothetical protein HDU78_000308, partial [Chytriomyces hyalinus]
MDATPVANYTKVKTVQAGATTMAKSSSTSGQVQNPELKKLAAYADAGEFTVGLRQYLLTAEQKFGHGGELYLPKDKRGDTILFHPTTFKPTEPETTAQFEARHSSIAQALEDKYKKQQDLVFKLATQLATPADATIASTQPNTGTTSEPQEFATPSAPEVEATNMEVDQQPTPTLEMAKLKLEQDKLNLENYKRQFEREARFYTLKKTEYEGNLRVYKNLLK